MIRPEKNEPALQSVHAILVCLRSIAADGTWHPRIVDVLDIAEELPTLFGQKEDMTNYFRGALTEIVRIDARFGLALEYFDQCTR